MALNLQQYRKASFDHSPEALAKAESEMASQRLAVDVLHQVKITEVPADKIKQHDNNPDWLQFQIKFENAEGHRGQHTVLAPLTGNTLFTTRAGKITKFPYGSFAKTLRILNLPDGTTFMRRVIQTDAKCLQDLIGFEFHVVYKWSDKKYHLEYDNDSGAYHLANGKGERVDCEPFMLPERDESDPDQDRYEEVKMFCNANALPFEINPSETMKPIAGANVQEVKKFLGKAAPKPSITAQINEEAPIEEEEEEEEEIENSEEQIEDVEEPVEEEAPKRTKAVAKKTVSKATKAAPEGRTIKASGTAKAAVRPSGKTLASETVYTEEEEEEEEFKFED